MNEFISKQDNKTIHFQDNNLEKAIRDKINKPKGEIHESDVKDIQELIIQHEKISNLEGIQYLTGLKKLILVCWK